jgi:DNA-binding TFAR19-related protein (PDSD5 family)
MVEGKRRGRTPRPSTLRVETRARSAEIERQNFPAIRKPSRVFTRRLSSYICIGIARYCIVLMCTRRQVIGAVPSFRGSPRSPPDRDALAAADCLESKARTRVGRCRLSSRQGAEVVESSVKAHEASLQVVLLSASLFPVAEKRVSNLQIARQEAQADRKGE